MFKILLSLFLMFISFGLYAQSSFDKLNKNPFKQTQWYIGLRCGANYNTVDPINRFSIIKPTNDLDQGLYEKQYLSSGNISAIYGLTVMYQFDQRFVIGTNPSLNQIQFSYDQNLPGDVNSVTFEHQNNFQYFEVPVFFRYMIRPKINRFMNRSSRKPEVPGIIPFVQVGLNFNFLMDANKSVQKTINQNGIEISDISFNENVNEVLSPVTVGVFAGAGARFRLGNIYLTAEANFRQGLSNVTDANRRFANDNLINNAYDIYDDKSFQSVEFVLGVLVPLKYLSRKEFIPIEI